MNTYKVKWQGGSQATREASDMRALLAAMELGERRPEPVSIKRVLKEAKS